MDYKILKDKFGEDFAKMCRTMFPTILEQEGLLSQIILSKFEPNKDLYDDLVYYNSQQEFKNFIYKQIQNPEIKVKTDKTVRELFAEKGYDFFECHTEEDIQSFKKYYAKGEELCTFHGGRLEHCHVFWAVKKDVDSIKREDFKKPERQDPYGTSVISIQFSRIGNTLSIKNRYNHTVPNPDATFKNDLEEINSGLTDAFEREYTLKVNQAGNHILSMCNYVLANDGKIYKYNIEKNNIYYCPNNIIIDNGEVKRFDKGRYILMDCYLYDKKENKMINYDSNFHEIDAFFDAFNDISVAGTKNTVVVDKETKTNTLTINVPNKKPIIIKTDKNGRIIAYKNENITKIKDYFMYTSSYLKELEIPNVTEIGNTFLYYNRMLEKIDARNTIKIGNNFLDNHVFLEDISFPNLKEVGDFFLESNTSLKEINFPNLITAGTYFMAYNQSLKVVNLPNLITAGNDFLWFNTFTHFIHDGPEKVKEEPENKNLKVVNCPKMRKPVNALKKLKKIESLNNPERNKSYISNLKIFKKIKERILLRRYNKYERPELAQVTYTLEGEENEEEINNPKTR